jgi:LPXTG-motif cell wall-anchored protein
MQTYIVKSGDSLSKIALAFYGDETLYPLIAKANNVINVNLIYPGQSLTIPDKENLMTSTAKTPADTAAKIESAPAKGNKGYWIVGGLALAAGIAIVVYKKRKKKKTMGRIRKRKPKK